jgi:catechol 2,3-dioxygenase-like lactoylglutathione lyase family enzyme
MKRFHVHVAVEDLAASIRFYSTLFGTDPAVVKDDYAKWMLDDPRMNFAISQRGGKPGVNHLGLQTDSDAELEQLNAQLQQAELATHAEKEIACCYARSNKYWVTDPAGIAWEAFHTLGAVPTFDEAPAETAAGCCGPAVANEVACCAPQPKVAKIQIKAAKASSCCS